jgi:hypothetical protein
MIDEMTTKGACPKSNVQMVTYKVYLVRIVHTPGLHIEYLYYAPFVGCTLSPSSSVTDEAIVLFVEKNVLLKTVWSEKNAVFPV